MSIENEPCIEYVVQGKNAVISILDEHIRSAERVNQIKQAMINAVGSHPCKSVVVDMGRVEFIGSIGLLAFLGIRRLPGIENVVLCNLDENVKEIFMTCRLISNDKTSKAPFQLATSIESALERCNALDD
jgi:anti-anti-sigma factor